jgi:hypothetical protein
VSRVSQELQGAKVAQDGLIMTPDERVLDIRVVSRILHVARCRSEGAVAASGISSEGLRGKGTMSIRPPRGIVRAIGHCGRLSTLPTEAGSFGTRTRTAGSDTDRQGRYTRHW